MITVKDLNLSSPLFYVTHDEIKVKHLELIESASGNRYNLKLCNLYYRVNDLPPDCTSFEYESFTYFLNLDDAQKEQERLRAKYIKSLFNDMSESITAYNSAILKYFNKPLSNPFKDEKNYEKKTED